MTDITVKSLAAEINISVDYLLQQFTAIGLNKTAVDYITEKEKESLLIYINSELYDSNINNKFTLQRKTRSKLNITNSSGKSKFVQIEIRKKHTYKKEKVKKNESCDINLEESQHNKSKNILNIINKVNENILLDKEINKKKYFEKELIEDKKNNLYKSSNSYKKDKYDISLKKDEFEYKNRIKSLKKEKNIIYNLKLDNEEIYSIDRSIKNKQKINKKNINLRHSFKKPIQMINRDVVIVGETITVSELSNKMAVKASQVIKSLMNLGVMSTINQVIDKETAQLVAEDMGHKVIIKSENELEEYVISYCNKNNNSINAEFRAPVVTIMGHVDHGKTSLLDYIRLTKVAMNEEGGITQHIGAYNVEINEKKNITFIDTPGHAAFTAMRIRGAMITDIIVLVVAADDGVMPQTIEAIKHARDAKVPVVVAINKIDKKEANPINVKNELLKYDLIPEEWGGENQFVNISAKSGEGIENLLDAILLQAEVLELKAIRNGIASGIVIESCLDKSRGPLATVLVYEGTLKCGDVVLCGLEYGRVRAMRNELGKNIFYAGPSIPVEILGLSGIPIAGDTLTVVNDEKKAREVAIYRKGKYRAVKLASKQQTSNIENIFNENKEKKTLQLNIVFKTDVQGTSEAISNALKKLSTEEVKINIICFGVGSITENDAMLSAASNAILIGFNVRTEASARRVIELEKIDIRYYSVIYDLIKEIKIIMNNKLIPEYKEEIIGRAEVKNIFNLSKKNVYIAGCIMIEGFAKRNTKIRILRKNNVIYEGEIESLRRFKEDINEINNGMECGIGVKYNDIRSGDIIEILDINKIKQHVII